MLCILHRPRPTCILSNTSVKLRQNLCGEGTCIWPTSHKCVRLCMVILAYSCHCLLNHVLKGSVCGPRQTWLILFCIYQMMQQYETNHTQGHDPLVFHVIWRRCIVSGPQELMECHFHVSTSLWLVQPETHSCQAISSLLENYTLKGPKWLVDMHL